MRCGQELSSNRTPATTAEESLKSGSKVLAVIIRTAASAGAILIAREQLPRSRPDTADSAVSAPNGWQKVELRYFSLVLPGDMKRADVEGIDSAVYEYVSAEITVDLDFGRYPADFSSYRREREFREEVVRIGGRRAEICTYLNDEDGTDITARDKRFVAGANFLDTGLESHALTIWVSCKDRRDLDIAKTIFRSVRFANR